MIFLLTVPHELKHAAIYVKEDHFTMPNAMRLSYILFSSSINSLASNSYA
jgi:hypothetical protein